jgi:hypothetical protein
MFSKFNGGIKNIYPNKKPVSITELVQLIKCNPEAVKINTIRELRINGDEAEYKKLKRTLTYITPNCVLYKRDLKDPNNFIYPSGYIYLDFDGMKDVKAFKTDFINKYGDLVSMVCISSGAGGITVLVKTNVELNPNNFQPAWEFLAYNVFSDYSAFIDENTKDMGRAMFISFDPDVYSNFQSEVVINTTVLKTNQVDEKGANQCITYGEVINTLKCTFPYQLLEYDQVHNNIVLQTPVQTINSIVDYNPIEFVGVRFPNTIPDGYKHKVYTLMIHYLVHLNPHLSPDYIYTFIYFINKTKAKPPMEKKELQRLFLLVYGTTQQEGYEFKNEKIKNFHINKSSNLDRTDKLMIMNKCNGKIRSKICIDKILNAKSELKSLNEKITQKKVAELSGVSIRTVKKYYWCEESIDIISVTTDINNEFRYYSTTTTSTTINGFTTSRTDDIF